jgi:hypothetical protein
MILQRLASVISIAIFGSTLLTTYLLVQRSPFGQQFAIAASASVFLAFVTPFVIIAIRHQVRRERLKHIELFAENFAFEPVESARNCKGGLPDLRERNVSFEFVRAKYFADLDTTESFRKLGILDLPRFPMMMHSDWMLLFCAVPYMVLSGFGVFILFAPVAAFDFADGALANWFMPSILSVGGTAKLPAAELQQLHVNVLTVAGLAFAGAYFFSLRLFLRAVIVFDLSPATFLRAFAHMVLSVTLAVVLFRFLPDWSQLQQAWNSAGDTATGFTTTTSASSGLNGIWLVAAFGLGFVPESALDHVLRFSRLTYKRRYSEVELLSPVVPLTIIDGIDVYTAFRLEEANIHDVQNLATYNPIMLHIESPFGIYQTIDWVAQAQLCTVVGPDRFLLLKAFNIRTVFDLQQAVLGENADPDIAAAVGRIIVSDTTRDGAMRAKLIVSSAEAVSGTTRAEFSGSAVRHLVWVMLDDLHVHRLRQLWNKIVDRLDPNVPADQNPNSGALFSNTLVGPPALLAANAAVAE